MSKLTLGSLFDGSGGFPLGGMLCGIEPIWASEIEPFPIRVTTKRLPSVKHLGDINKIKGDEIEPVDIITFGSPCTDLSVAGKREGLSGQHSSLFYEAIRVIKEMRCKTNGEYPKYIVWENVPGAFSSNKGQDFKAVLESIAAICEKEISIPKPEKWRNAGEIMGNGYSIAWRVIDAQYFRVPQRRKRIYLVADFNSECAGKILFESESLSGNIDKSSQTRKRATVDAEGSFREPSTVCLNDQGGSVMNITVDRTNTLRATANHPPLVFENHSQDCRYNGPLEISQTVSATYGTGGNNQPFVICVQGSSIGRTSKNCPNGDGINEDVSFTLTTIDKHAIVYAIDRESFNCGQNYVRNIGFNEKGISPTLTANGPSAVGIPTYSSSKASFFTRAKEECANTLVATDYKEPPIINQKYIVRRLTPKECARLQGFPDWWCDGLETEDPCETDVKNWNKVFEAYKKALGKNTKQKTRNQIIKWLKNPHSDSAEYKMWGNGVALPCVIFVLNAINQRHQINCENP